MVCKVCMSTGSVLNICVQWQVSHVIKSLPSLHSLSYCFFLCHISQPAFAEILHYIPDLLLHSLPINEVMGLYSGFALISANFSCICQTWIFMHHEFVVSILYYIMMNFTSFVPYLWTCYLDVHWPHLQQLLG